MALSEKAGIEFLDEVRGNIFQAHLLVGDHFNIRLTSGVLDAAPWEALLISCKHDEAMATQAEELFDAMRRRAPSWGEWTIKYSGSAAA